MNIIVFMVFFFSASLGLAKETVLVTQPSEFGREKRHQYFSELIELALKHANLKQSYRLKAFGKDQQQSQNIKSVIEGEIDIMWTMTSSSREAVLEPIRIPLYKGMLGTRICIVRKKDVNAFSGIKSLADFIQRGKTIGQGSDWPDTLILKRNKLEVVTSQTYEELFPKLRSGKFDCFARGINEPWSEIEKYGNTDLVVDRYISFMYRSPVFFFVNKDRKDLAQVLSKGLHVAIENGSFDRHFHAYNGDFVKRANMGSRVNIFLKNLDLTQESQEIARQSKYWLRVD
ncbi:MAG: transporter substrate-binding domain-containing protein [Pseudobacteriovorax sp.]|nr:transporter substrate-binding domain-containing protein [Pseudobacteriovorax sp.]